MPTQADHPFLSTRCETGEEETACSDYQWVLLLTTVGILT